MKFVDINAINKNTINTPTCNALPKNDDKSNDTLTKAKVLENILGILQYK